MFTVEDFRIMLGQRIAVPILLPLAVDVLVSDPYAEGDYYPGDLLWAVLRLPASAWSARPEMRQRLATAVAAADLDDIQLPEGAHDAVVSLLRPPRERRRAASVAASADRWPRRTCLCEPGEARRPLDGSVRYLCIRAFTNWCS